MAVAGESGDVAFGPPGTLLGDLLHETTWAAAGTGCSLKRIDERWKVLAMSNENDRDTLTGAPQVPAVAQVLVVGAGPVGLVAAIELARRGIQVRIIDASERPSDGSRGKGLQPRSIEVLDDLGVAGRVLATGRSRLSIRKYRGTAVLGTSEVNPGSPEATAATPYPRTLLIPQWRVEEALREKLSELGVSVEYGSKLIGLTQDEDLAYIRVRTASGIESFAATYVIGSDGASSTVRKLVDIGFLGQTDETVRVFTGDVEISGLDRDFWHWWPSPDGRLLALCPLPSTDTYQLQIGVSADTAGKLSVDEIQSLVDERTGRTDIQVRRVAWQSIWRFNVRMVERYRAGRVFLAGDSAHVHPPAGGLGMNTGIQDAYNVAWKIAHVLGGAPQTLLDTYEQERLPVAAEVLNLSSELIAGRVRGVVPGEGQATDTLQLKVCYPVTALNGSAREGGSAVQAGDRAPDSLGLTPQGTEVRLFDMLRGTHATALAFGPRSTAIATALATEFPLHLRSVSVLSASSLPSAPPDSLVVIDADGHAHRDYDVDGDTLLIVRPDGYVAARVTDADKSELLGYLSLWLPRK